MSVDIMLYSNEPNSGIIVSVIIPTHHRKKLVIKLLQSLNKQSLPAEHFEVIVVHNFTDDGTDIAIARWRDEHSMAIRYYKKNYNSPTASRQFGAEQANGKYIAFIDDDCIATKDWLISALMCFDDQTSLNTISPDNTVGLVQGRTLPNPTQPRRFLEKTVEISKLSVFFETCNIFYRKDVFQKVGGFSAEFLENFYGEDTDLGWKVKLKCYQIRFNADALVYHEVFHVSLWQWLKEPLYFRNIPYLVKKFPALRGSMYANYFLTKESALFHLLVIGVVASVILGKGALLFTLPYFFQRYRSGNKMPNIFFRFFRILAGLPRGFITWFALLRGSIKYRCVLL